MAQACLDQGSRLTADPQVHSPQKNAVLAAAAAPPMVSFDASGDPDMPVVNSSVRDLLGSWRGAKETWSACQGCGAPRVSRRLHPQGCAGPDKPRFLGGCMPTEYPRQDSRVRIQQIQGPVNRVDRSAVSDDVNWSDHTMIDAMGRGRD